MSALFIIIKGSVTVIKGFSNLRRKATIFFKCSGHLVRFIIITGFPFCANLHLHRIIPVGQQITEASLKLGKS